MSVGPPTLTHLIARERSHMASASPAAHDPTPGTQAQARQWFEAEPLWFKRAVFYEIHIRGFFDADGDGSGDFRGLTEKLDYLQWLGIDCIWLLPFYGAPCETAVMTSPTSPRSTPTTATSTTCTS